MRGLLSLAVRSYEGMITAAERLFFSPHNFSCITPSISWENLFGMLALHQDLDPEDEDGEGEDFERFTEGAEEDFSMAGAESVAPSDPSPQVMDADMSESPSSGSEPDVEGAESEEDDLLGL